MFSGVSRFLRIRISEVTLVPEALKAVFGKRIAPTNSALAAMSSLALDDFLSMVPELVIATT